MRISTFNINMFCGPYKNTSGYYNPRDIDFRTPIKEIVDSLLKNEYDIIFLQEFTSNKFIKVEELFPKEHYNIFYNCKSFKKSHVVAITLNDNRILWEHIKTDQKDYANKFINMKLKTKNLKITCFHKTKSEPPELINNYFNRQEDDIILGDFNNKNKLEYKNYRDLVTCDMITFKPAQTTIDHIFVKNNDEFTDKIVFNGVIETFTSDHNLLTFELNI